MNTRVFLLLLAILVLVGGLALLGGTRWGIGASPDSVYYISAARNLLSGQGYSIPAADGSNTPLTHLPPFYSAILALFGLMGFEVIQVARWTNVFLLCANILIIGLLVGQWAGPGERWIALAGTFVFLTSIAVLQIHLMAWSEPLFILLGLLSMVLLGRYLISQRMGWLVASALFTGLAFLTRFAGAAFMITGVIGILLFTRVKLRRRLLDALLFTMISCLPTFLWLISTLITTGNLANRPLAYHPVSKQIISQALTTLASWLFIPENSGTLIKFIVIALVGLGVLLTITAIVRQEKETQDAPVSMRFESVPVVVQLLLVLGLVYFAFLLFSLSFFDANIPLDHRILSPLFVLGLAVIGYVLIQIYKWFGKQSIYRWVIMFVICLLCVLYLVNGTSLLVKAYQAGIGYNSADWQHSPTIKRIQQLPEGASIYSNGPEGIFLHTGQTARALPQKFNPVEQQQNPNYSAQLMTMQRKLGEGGVIVYFKGLDWPNLPTEKELVEILPLRILAQYEDGTIYEAVLK